METEAQHLTMTAKQKFKICEFVATTLVRWLGLSVTVRVRVRARDREWIFHSFFFYLKNDKHICLAFIAWSDEEPWQKGLISACIQLHHSLSPH